jgi:hypothetical protein
MDTSVGPFITDSTIAIQREYDRNGGVLKSESVAKLDEAESGEGKGLGKEKEKEKVSDSDRTLTLRNQFDSLADLKFGDDEKAKNTKVKEVGEWGDAAKDDDGNEQMHLVAVTKAKYQKVSFVTQFSALMGRSFKHLIRTPSLLVAHIAIAVILGGK